MRVSFGLRRSTTRDSAGKAEQYNPYLAARREWDERYGDQIARARNWRTMAALCALVALLETGGLLWMSARSRVLPFVVLLDHLGRPVASGFAGETSTNDDRVKRATIFNWVENLRLVTTDGVAQRKAIDFVYAHIANGSSAEAFINEFYRSDPPSKRAQTGRQNQTLAVTRRLKTNERRLGLMLCMATSGPSRRTGAARFGPFVRIAVLSFGGVVIAFQICGWLGIRINTSPSLPLGFYITTSDATARLIEFCPTEPFASFALSRGYRDRGSCPDGGAPLLKPIVARHGDVVQVSNKGISANGELLPNTEPLARDTKGRSLRPWPFGSYAVNADSVWVGSSYNKRSFDSRYFGPVSTSSIRERLRPLLTVW